MSVFHRIQSVSFFPYRPFSNWSPTYLHTPVSLQIREISAQTIEDFYLGLNPRYPYSMLNEWKDGYSMETAKNFILKRIIADVDDVLKQPHPLYDTDALRTELNAIKLLFTDGEKLTNFSRLMYEMVLMEITCLNDFILSNPYHQQPNIVEQSLENLVKEITVLAENINKVSESIQNESRNLQAFMNNLQQPMDTSFNNLEQIQTFHTYISKNQSDYDLNVEILVIELREILNFFVGKKLTTMWNHQKQLEAIGISFTNPLTLEAISPACERILKSLKTILGNLKLEIKIHVQGQLVHRDWLFNRVFEYFKAFLQSTFFVYVQPPLVIPKDAKMLAKQISREDPTREESIPVSTYLLVACGPDEPNYLHVNLKKNTDIYLMNEDHVKKLIRGGLLANMMTECVKPVKFVMESQRTVNSSSNNNNERNVKLAEFDGAKLVKRIKNGNGSNRQQGRVVEEKCAVVFFLKLNFFDQDFSIWTMSLPVTVSSHGVQKSLGMFAILRDYLTAGMIRTPFEIPHPDYITWKDLSDVILYFFRKCLGDKTLNLPKEDLECIQRKAAQFVQAIEPHVTFSPDRIKWENLVKNVFENPEDLHKKFSFFDWIDAAFTTLTKPKMIDIWKMNFLKFIDKQPQPESFEPNEEQVNAKTELIKVGVPGTFLLRFSDKCLGAISIVYYGQDGEVHHTNPKMSKDIDNHGLLKEIRENKKIFHIYGFGYTPKDELLKHVYPYLKQTPTINGYE